MWYLPNYEGLEKLTLLKSLPHVVLCAVIRIRVVPTTLIIGILVTQLLISLRVVVCCGRVWCDMSSGGFFHIY